MRRFIPALGLCWAVVIVVFLHYGGYVYADGVSYSVTAVVLPVRVIYINGNGEIYKIATNTDKIIKPEVIYNNRLVAITNKTQYQYKHILKNCVGNNRVGVLYSGRCNSTPENNASFQSRISTVANLNWLDI